MNAPFDTTASTAVVGEVLGKTDAVPDRTLVYPEKLVKSNGTTKKVVAHLTTAATAVTVAATATSAKATLSHLETPNDSGIESLGTIKVAAVTSDPAIGHRHTATVATVVTATVTKSHK